MKKILTIFSLCLSFTIFAANTHDYSRFEDKTIIKTPDIITPKVIIMETPDYFAGNTILINENSEVISHTLIRETENIIPIDSITTSSRFEGTPQNLVDQNSATFLTFDPTDSEKKITIKFDAVTEVSQVVITLADSVIRPRYLTVYGVFQDKEKSIIIDNQSFSHYVPFPAVLVTELEILLDTPHFLRINEISVQGQGESKTTNKLVFFAENNKSYTLYSRPHFGQNYYQPQQFQPLTFDEKTPIFSLPIITKNSDFNDDFDDDGIIDEQDYCPRISDPKNTDIDANGRGDVCEDPDQDGIISANDNCPFIYNVDQKDSDLDNLGDACDDSENRALENSAYLLYGIFSIAALFLLVLVWRSFKK